MRFDRSISTRLAPPSRRFRAFFAGLTAAMVTFSGSVRAQSSEDASDDERGEARAEAYFERDAEDPCVLVPTDRVQTGGFDRGYVELMARPPIPRDVLDAAEQSGAPARIGALPAPSQPLTVHASALRGNIFVIEGDAQNVSSQNGQPAFNHNGPGLQSVVGQLWEALGDNFDFITVFTTFDDPGVAAYYMPLQNNTKGLGACDFNAGQTFGCEFNQFNQPARLQGFVFMNSLSYWDNWDRNYQGTTFNYDDLQHSVYAVLGQEVAHRWGSGLRFVDPRTGNMSNKLLGRDQSHWAAWVDTDASVMDGWDWEDQGDGTFKLVDAMQRFSTLDLYTMGAMPVAGAKPFYFIDNARYVPNRVVRDQAIPGDAVLQVPYPKYLESQGIELAARGERVDLTIQDIVNAEGNRCPDPDHAQATFRQAIVLLTRPGETIAQAADDVANLDAVRVAWESWWADRTMHRQRLCTDTIDTCRLPKLALGAMTMSDLGTKDGVVDLGENFDLTVDAASIGEETVQNARMNVTLVGNGAENATFYAQDSTLSLGDMPEGGTGQGKLALNVGAEYTCGHSLVAQVTLEADNAASVTESYRVFPGYATKQRFSFEDDDGGFVVNEDGKDNASSGALAWTSDVQTSCVMNARDPERDVTPEGKGAFVTGEGEMLAGETSLWSPALDTAGLVAPEVRFSYWLEGDAGDELQVSLSADDGKSWTRAKTYTAFGHDWALGRVDVKGTLGNVPDSVRVRFIFASGSGKLEGGLDEVLVLEPAAACAPSGCGCTTAASGADLAGGGMAFALLMVLRRRRR